MKLGRRQLLKALGLGAVSRAAFAGARPGTVLAICASVRPDTCRELEAAGLVRRAPDPTDRRASLIEATETGAEVFAQNREKWLGALRDLLCDWTAAERHLEPDAMQMVVVGNASAVREGMDAMAFGPLQVYDVDGRPT